MTSFLEDIYQGLNKLTDLLPTFVKLEDSQEQWVTVGLMSRCLDRLISDFYRYWFEIHYDTAVTDDYLLEKDNWSIWLNELCTLSEKVKLNAAISHEKIPEKLNVIFKWLKIMNYNYDLALESVNSAGSSEKKKLFLDAYCISSVLDDSDIQTMAKQAERQDFVTKLLLSFENCNNKEELNQNIHWLMISDKFL